MGIEKTNPKKLKYLYSRKVLGSRRLWVNTTLR